MPKCPRDSRKKSKTRCFNDNDVVVHRTPGKCPKRSRKISKNRCFDDNDNEMMFRSSARYLENPNSSQLNPSNSSAHSKFSSNLRNRKLSAIRKKIQTRKIFKFMKNVNPHKRRAFFLKAVCSNSGVCLAFGKETAKINQHFDFASFNYMTKATTFGEYSANAFVKLIEYQNEGYLANAILKSSIKSTSDNLYYEYLVGQFINKQLLY